MLTRDKVLEERYIYILCDRCGERIRDIVNPYIDITTNKNISKVAIGNKCFNCIRFTVHFDEDKLTEVGIDGGSFITSSQYAQDSSEDS